MLVDTIEKVKKVSIGYVGSNGLFDSATVNAYTASLRGLSATQAEVVLSSAGLDSAQRKQIISALEATAATRTLTSEEALSAMTRKMGSAEAAKELLIKSELVTADQLEAGAEFQVSTEKLKSAVSSGILSQSEADNIAVALGLTGTNIGLGTSFKLLTASIWANIKALAVWLVTNPVGWAILAGGALFGLAKITDALTVSVEEQREKLENLKGEYAEIESELKSLNDELTTTQQRMAELEGKGNLTFTEKEEYDNLVKVNNELQRKIDLLELEEKNKRKEKNKTFVSTMEKDTEDPFEHEVDPDGKPTTGQYSIGDEYLTSEIGYIEAQFEIRKQLLDDLSKAETKDEQDRIQDRIDEIDKYLQDKNTQWASDMDGIEYIDNPSTEDEEKVNQWLDFINDFQDRMAIAMGGDNAKTNAFNRVVDNWQFDDTVQELQDLGKQGQVTAEMLDNPKYDAFIQKLYELGIIDSVDNLDAVALAFNNVGTNAETASGNVNKMTVSLSELEGASDKIKTLGSAFKELSDDGYITTKTLGEIQTATGLSGNEWAEYEDKLLNAKTGSAEFNRVMGELTYAILENQLGTEKLANADEDYIEAILRENGVLNANGVAHDMVERAKIANQVKTIDLANAIEDGSIIALKNEALQCGYTESAFWSLVAQEKIFNNTSLDVTQQISALKSLEIQAGITKGALSGLSGGNSIGDKLNDAYSLGVKANEKGNIEFNGRDYGRGQDAYNQAIADAMAVAFQKDLESKFKDVETKFTGGVNYSGDSKSDSGSDKNKPDYEDPTEAIINRINLRSKELEKQEQSIEDALEVAEIEKDYEKQISLTNDLINKRKDRLTELETANAGLHNEAEWQRNIHTFYNEDGTESDENLWFDSQGNATMYYNALINKTGITTEEREAIEDLFEKLSKYKKAYAENAEEITELNKEILQDEEKIWDLRREEFDERLEESEYYIQHSNDFGWENGDNEVKARKRVLDWIQSDYYKSLIKDDEEYYKILEENRLKYNEALKEMTDDLLNEIQTKLDESYDIRISRLNSESSLLSAHYGVLNAINEEQHNLNKELLEAETIGARMNEQERETLFTKKEHTRLTGKLEEVMDGINVLQHNYQHDLETATENTIEEITNNYERQYELKMKEYEIVRAELDLMRKQQILENTQNEKSVRTWNGSSWIYEANLQDVLDAQEEVENAKYELAKAKIEEAQQTALHAIDASADALQTEKNKLTSVIEDMAEKMSGSGKNITNMLETIAKTDLPMFDSIIKGLGGSLKGILGISDEDINEIRNKNQGIINENELNTIIGLMKENSDAWHTADDNRRTYLEGINRGFADYLGLEFEPESGRWKKKDGTYAYASGTKNTKRGAGLFDENGFGSELILTDGGVLTQFNGGERVFSSEMADRLWEMAQQNYNFAPTIVQPDFGKLIPIEDKINNAISNISNAFGDTYMIKDVQLNESEGGTLKGFMNFLKKKI